MRRYERTLLVRLHTGRRHRASVSGGGPPPSGAAFALPYPRSTRCASCTGQRALCECPLVPVIAERGAAIYRVRVEPGADRVACPTPAVGMVRPLFKPGGLGHQSALVLTEQIADHAW